MLTFRNVKLELTLLYLPTYKKNCRHGRKISLPVLVVKVLKKKLISILSNAETCLFRVFYSLPKIKKNST